MGKAAKNETLKIRATYYNNIAVGLFVAGAAIPYLSLFPRTADLSGWFWPDPFSESGLKKLTAVIFGISIAMAMSWFYRRQAKKILAGLED
jgi:hypothetical protein